MARVNQQSKEDFQGLASMAVATSMVASVEENRKRPKEIPRKFPPPVVRSVVLVQACLRRKAFMRSFGALEDDEELAELAPPPPLTAVALYMCRRMRNPKFVDVDSEATTVAGVIVAKEKGMTMDVVANVIWFYEGVLPDDHFAMISLNEKLQGLVIIAYEKLQETLDRCSTPAEVQAAVEDARRTYQVLPELEGQVFGCADVAMREVTEKAEVEIKAMIKKSVTTLEYKECERELERIYGPVETHLRDDLEVACLRRVQFLEMELETRWSRPFAGPLPPHSRAARRYELELGLVPSVQAFLKEERSHAAKLEAQFEVQIIALQGRLRNLTAKRKEARVRYVIQDLDQKLVDASSALQRAIEEALVNLGPDNELVTRRARELLSLEAHTAVYAMFAETTAEELRNELEANDTSPEAADRLRGVASALAGALLQLNAAHPYQVSLREEFKEELAAVAENRPEPAAEPPCEPQPPPRGEKKLADVETEAAAPKAAAPTTAAAAAPQAEREATKRVEENAAAEKAAADRAAAEKQVAEKEKRRQAIRAELQSLKVRELLARADDLGATEHELDAVDAADKPKMALIELIVDKTIANQPEQDTSRAQTAEVAEFRSSMLLESIAEQVTFAAVEEAAPPVEARSALSSATTGVDTDAAPARGVDPASQSLIDAIVGGQLPGLLDTKRAAEPEAAGSQPMERRRAAVESKPSELSPRAAAATTSLADALASGQLEGLLAKRESSTAATAPAAPQSRRADAAPAETRAYTGPVEPVAGMPTSAWLPPSSTEAAGHPTLEPIAPALQSPGHSTVDEPEFEDTWASPPGYDHVEVRVKDEERNRAAGERAFKMPGVDIPLTTAEAGVEDEHKIDPNALMMLQSFDAETLLKEKNAMAPSGITVKLTLQDLTMDVVKLHTEAVFKAKFQRALSDAASIPKERITIQGFQPGSVIVMFHVKEPLPGETPPPVESNRTRGAPTSPKTAEQVFEELKKQVADGGSKLRLGEVGPFVSNATIERGVGTTSNKVDHGSLSSAYVAPAIGGLSTSDSTLKPSEKTDRNMAWTASTAPGETMARGPGMGTTAMTWGAATGAPSIGAGETSAPGPQFRTTCPKDPAPSDNPWTTPYQQQELYTFYDRTADDVHPRPPLHEAPPNTRAPKQKFQQHATFCLTRHPVKGTDAYKDLPVPQSPTIAAAASWLENAEAELKDPGLDSIGKKTDWPDFKDLGKKAKTAKALKEQKEAEAELEGEKSAMEAPDSDLKSTNSTEVGVKGEKGEKKGKKKGGKRQTITKTDIDKEPAGEPEPEASGAETDRSRTASSPTPASEEAGKPERRNSSPRGRPTSGKSATIVSEEEDDGGLSSAESRVSGQETTTSPESRPTSAKELAKEPSKPAQPEGSKEEVDVGGSAVADPISDIDSSDAASPKSSGKTPKAKKRSKDSKPLRVVVEEGGQRRDPDVDPRSPSIEESRARSDERSDRGARTGPSPRPAGRQEASLDRELQSGREPRKGMSALRPPAVDTRERGERGMRSPKSPTATKAPKTPVSGRPHSQGDQPSPFDSMESRGPQNSQYIGMLGGIPNTGVRHQTDANTRLPALVGKPSTDDLRSPAFMYQWYRHETTGVGPPYKTTEEEHQETPQWTAMQMLDATLDRNDWKRSYSWATRRVGRGRQEWSIRGASLGPSKSIRAMQRSHSAGQAPRHLPPVVRRSVRDRQSVRDHHRPGLPPQAWVSKPPSSEKRLSEGKPNMGQLGPTLQDERPPTRDSIRSQDVQEAGTTVGDAIDMSELPGQEAAEGTSEEAADEAAATAAEEAADESAKEESGTGKKKKRERVKLREKEPEVSPEEQAALKAQQEKAEKEAKDKKKKEKAAEKNKEAKDKIKKDKAQKKEEKKRKEEEERLRKLQEEEDAKTLSPEEAKRAEAAAYAKRMAEESKDKKNRKKDEKTPQDSEELDMSKLEDVLAVSRQQVLHSPRPFAELQEDDKAEEADVSRGTTAEPRGDSRTSSTSPSPASPKGRNKEKGKKKGKKKGGAKETESQSPSPANTTTPSSRIDASLAADPSASGAEAKDRSRKSSAIARADAELLRLLQEEARLAEAIAAQEAEDAEREAEDAQEKEACIGYSQRVSMRAAQSTAEFKTSMPHDLMVHPGEIMPEDDGTITAPATRANTMDVSGVADAISMDEVGTTPILRRPDGQLSRELPARVEEDEAAPAQDEVGVTVQLNLLFEGERIETAEALAAAGSRSPSVISRIDCGTDSGPSRPISAMPQARGQATSGTAVADAIDMSQADHPAQRGDFKRALPLSLYAGFHQRPTSIPAALSGAAREEVAAPVADSPSTEEVAAPVAASSGTDGVAVAEEEVTDASLLPLSFPMSPSVGSWLMLNRLVPQTPHEADDVRSATPPSQRPSGLIIQEEEAGTAVADAIDMSEVTGQQDSPAKESAASEPGRRGAQLPVSPTTENAAPAPARRGVPDSTATESAAPAATSPALEPEVATTVSQTERADSAHVGPEAPEPEAATFTSETAPEVFETSAQLKEEEATLPRTLEEDAALPQTEDPDWEPTLFPLSPSVGSWLLLAPPGALAALQGPSGTAVADAIEAEDAAGVQGRSAVASWLEAAPAEARDKLDAMSRGATPAGSKTPTQVGEPEEGQDAGRARLPFWTSQSVWTWYMAAPPKAPEELVLDIERVIEREPEQVPKYVRRPQIDFALSPSVGAWLRTVPPRVSAELKEIASQHAEEEEEVVPIAFNFSPSVGSWLQHSMPARAHLAAALEKFREEALLESYKRPDFIHCPSVGAWLCSALARGSITEALEAIQAASAGTAVADAIDSEDIQMVHDFTTNLLRRAEETAQERRRQMSKRSSAIMAPGYTQSLLARLAERQQPDSEEAAVQPVRPGTAEKARLSAHVLASDLLRRGEEASQERSRHASKLAARPYTQLLLLRVVERQQEEEADKEATSHAAVREADRSQARGDFRQAPRASFGSIHGLFAAPPAVTPARPEVQEPTVGQEQPVSVQPTASEPDPSLRGDFRSGPRDSFSAIHGLFGKPSVEEVDRSRTPVRTPRQTPTPRSAIGTEPDDEGSPDLGPRRPAEPPAHVEAPAARVDRPAPTIRPASPALPPHAAATRRARTNAGATREQVLSFAQSLTSSIFRTSNNLAMQRAASQPQLHRFGAPADATATPSMMTSFGTQQRPASPAAPSTGTGYGTQHRFVREHTMLPQSRATQPPSPASPAAPGPRLPSGSPLGETATPSNTRAPAAPTRRSPTRDSRKPVSPIPAEETAFFF